MDPLWDFALSVRKLQQQLGHTGYLDKTALKNEWSIDQIIQPCPLHDTVHLGTTHTIGASTETANIVCLIITRVAKSRARNFFLRLY